MGLGRPIKLRGEGEEHDLGMILGRLKDRGCSILVSGVVPITTFQLVSRRLFGHPEERRLRTLIRLRPTTSLDEWFPAGVGLEDARVRVVDCTAPDRSASGDRSDFGRLRWNSKFDPAETPGLSRRSTADDCTDEIDSLVAEAGTLGSAQLRVGAYSLDALEDHNGMIDFVRTVSETVSAHRGIAHYHLERPPTSDTTQTLLEHVDAMISVRKDVPDEPPRQKWTISEFGESPWVPLDRYD